MKTDFSGHWQRSAEIPMQTGYEKYPSPMDITGGMNAKEFDQNEELSQRAVV
jgi:hypothetical protein